MRPERQLDIAAGLALNRPRLRELLKRGKARLIGQVVLAVAHRRDAQACARIGNAGAGDQVDRGVLEYLGGIARLGPLRVASSKIGGELRLRRAEGRQFTTRLQ